MPFYTGLILVSGEDRPGITENLMRTLSQFAVTINDIQQIVIRGRLILTILITLDEAHSEAIVEDLNTLQNELQADIAVDFSFYQEVNRPQDLLRVIIIGKEIRPISLALVAAEVTKLGGNIDDIRRLSSAPIIALELFLSLPNSDIKQVQSALSKVAVANRIDLSVQLGGSASQLKRVVLLDMDSTLIEEEVIDILASYAGKSQIASEITKKAMAGEMDFNHSLNSRVSLLAGLDESVLMNARKQITFTTGAQALVEQLHKLGHEVGVVSGGFIDVIEPILHSLKVDFYRANKLEIQDGKLTGKLVGKIIDSDEKANALQEFANLAGVDLQQTVAIGDGANDLKMIQTAGLGIAFNAKPKVVESADSTISFRDLSAVLPLMGIRT
ncbi:MAG: phosphoserine phosphatase SerB [Actinobacteria bacterium]|jgi:phosphoserine phosphatase|nr:phosphoserine phosphatase SerB [Actinomycetota bacterium]